VPSRRNKAAAKKFFRKLLTGCTYVPGLLITDKLASYGAEADIYFPRALKFFWLFED
jgi:transposase-like protein